MQKRFELWLDESGDFKNQKKLKAENKYPSLIGGILLEKHIAETIEIDELIDDSHNHAMNFTDEQKRTFSLPVLEKLKKEYGAKEVFFENLTYTDEETNRQLYLRIMAEGLLQLLQTLNALWESVQVEVVIAQRQDVDAKDSNQRRISDAEYINILNQTMQRKRRMRRLYINDDSELKFIIRPAHKEKRLQAADFACNTRLTRGSKAFLTCKDRLNNLYADAYIFSLAETGSDNYVRLSLAQGDISDAVMELYTSLDKSIHRKKILDMILTRMKNENYRIVKAQLKQCSNDIVTYAAMQDDYEVAEQLFKKIHDEFISQMKKEKIPCAHFEFTLLLWLADNYLREGDIIEARKCIQTCRKVQLGCGNSLEEIFTYYQLLEKESLLAIDEFDYKKGKEIMEKASEVYHNLMQFFLADKFMKERFDSMKSEYYGDALCMEIYAGLFLLKENLTMYDELRELSDLAMRQYPNELGELERHRQYRCRMESIKGEYKKAISYLFLAKEYNPEEINRKTLREFLDLVCSTEVKVSVQYYLMYYLLILTESKENGECTLSKDMFEVLYEQKRMLQYGEIHTSRATEMHSVDMNAAKEKASGVEYHPMEVIAWKYAYILYLDGKYEIAENYYIKAVGMCFSHNNYSTLVITGIGICAELIACLYKSRKEKQAINEYNKLLQKITYLKKQNLTDATILFVENLEKLLKNSKNEKGKLDPEKLLMVSKKITY